MKGMGLWTEEVAESGECDTPKAMWEEGKVDGHVYVELRSEYVPQYQMGDCTPKCC